MTGRGYGACRSVQFDQGIEHSVAASSANRARLDSADVCLSASEAGCNAVATTLGARAWWPGAMSTHNELLASANRCEQTMFASVPAAGELGQSVCDLLRESADNRGPHATGRMPVWASVDK